MDFGRQSQRVLSKKTKRGNRSGQKKGDEQICTPPKQLTVNQIHIALFYDNLQHATLAVGIGCHCDIQTAFNRNFHIAAADRCHFRTLQAVEFNSFSTIGRQGVSVETDVQTFGSHGFNA